MLVDDLTRLLQNANFTLSKRAFNALFGSGDKLMYRDLQEPSNLISLPSGREILLGQRSPMDDEGKNLVTSNIVEKNGTVYDVNQLIDKAEVDEKLKVKLSEELKTSKEKIRKNVNF